MRPKPAETPTLIRSLALSLWLAVPQTAAAQPDTVEALARLALAQNPELGAIEAQITALRSRVVQAGAWQDPKLVVAYQNVPRDSLALGEEGMSMVAVRLEQRVPFPGKTHEREAVAREAVRARQWYLGEKKGQLRALVKKAYYRLALARQLEAITAQHLALAGQLAEAVRGKYEVGRASQQELLRLDVLAGRLRDELDDFGRQDTELTATLNAALHRDVVTPIRTPSELRLQPPEDDLASLQERAAEHRPALRQLSATARMHRAAAELARSEAIPDPTVFAAYGLRKAQASGAGGGDLVTVGVGLPLPVFYGSRYGARAEEALASARAVDAERATRLDSIASALASALATWQRSVRKMRTYEQSLLPVARRSLDATLASYRVERANFLSLYEAQVELLGIERAIRTAAATGLAAQATIDMLVGKELP